MSNENGHLADVRENLKDIAIDYIRERIFEQRTLRCGEQVNERELSRTLCLSRAPIREALKELEEQGPRESRRVMRCEQHLAFATERRTGSVRSGSSRPGASFFFAQAMIYRLRTRSRRRTHDAARARTHPHSFPP